MPFFILCFLFLFSKATIAESSDKIVVTATREETPFSSVPHSIGQVAGETWNLRGERPEEVFSSVPGITFTSNGGTGQARSMLLRGAKAEHTLVLIDGVIANDPFSPTRSFNFGQLPVTEVERIEILKGPQSVLYGSDGIGGVVQIFTRKDFGRPRLRVEGGSYGTFRIRGGYQGLHAGFERSDGISAADSREGNKERDGHKAWNLGGAKEFAISDSFLLKLNALYFSSRTDTDLNGGRGGDSFGTYANSSQLLFRAEGIKAWENDWSWANAISANLHERDDNTLVPSFYKGEFWKWESLARKTLGSHRLVFGPEFSQESGNSNEVPTKHRFHNIAILAQDQTEFGRLHSTLGARADFHSEHERALTYRFGLGYWIIPEYLRAKGSFGSGYKAPSLYQTFSPLYGNRNLRPERSLGGDIGVEYAGVDFESELLWYQNRFDDLIEFQSTSVNAGRYVNLSQSETYGLEWGLAYSFWYITLRNALTTIHAKDRSTGQFLLRRPKLTDTVEATFRKGDFVGLTLRLRYVGQREDIHPTLSTRQKLPSYAVMGAEMFHQVKDLFRVTVRGENLLNRHYQDLSGYGTPGLSGYLGIEANL